MDKFRLENDGGRDVVFAGVQLAEASNHSYRGDRQNRWTEIDIYRTEAGRYVVSVVGRSQWQGETDQHTVTVCNGADAVLKALVEERYEGGDYLPTVARDALKEAAKADPVLATVEVEEVA